MLDQQRVLAAQPAAPAPSDHIGGDTAADPGLADATTPSSVSISTMSAAR